MNSQKQKDAR